MSIIRRSLGIICAVVPTDLYPGGVKTGELVTLLSMVHTSQSQDGVW